MAPTIGGGRGQRVRDEAAAWHARMMEPVSEVEVAAFEEWLGANPAHAQAYDRVQRVSSIAEGLPRRMLFEPSPRPPLRLRPAFSLAVAVLFLFIAGVWLVSPGSQPAYAAVSNPGPSVRGVRLSDGTGVILDSGAKLVVAFEDDARTVKIEAGRARFDVARDDHRPFSVEAPLATVTTGESMFDVAVQGQAARIYVMRGEAAVEASRGRSPAAPVRLRSGQAVSVRDGQLNGTMVQSAEARWPTSRLGFEDTPLATIVAIANRGAGPDIELQDEAIGVLKVTGVLDLRDTQVLARQLAATLDLQVQNNGRTILIAR